MDTLTGSMGGFDIGIPAFPNLHFPINPSDDLRHPYSSSGGSLMYDSPPINRKPKLQKQTSLDETNKKKSHNRHSPPMKKKSVPSSPQILEKGETLIEEVAKVDLDENQNTPNGTKKKPARKVSFADAVGKDLEQILTFVEPEEVKVKSVLPDMKPLELVLPLLNVDADDFKERFEKNGMILEKLHLGTEGITGRIRVKSVPGGEHRRVSVRYTKDGWMSFTKQPARNIPKMDSETSENSESAFDSYCFDISIDRHSPAIQFFLSTVDPHGKAEFEDNNDGQIYTVLNPNYLEPPVEEEEGEWEAYMRGEDEWCNDYY